MSFQVGGSLSVPPAAPGGFSLGLSSSQPAQTSGFSFGGAPAQNPSPFGQPQQQQQQPAGGFNFGGAAQPQQQQQQQQQPSAGGFNFGGGQPAQQQQQPASGGFNFAAPAAAGQPAAGAFNFSLNTGAAPGAQQQQQQQPGSTGAFSFGGSAAPSGGAAPGAFSFNTQGAGAAAAKPGAFNFSTGFGGGGSSAFSTGGGLFGAQGTAGGTSYGGFGAAPPPASDRFAQWRGLNWKDNELQNNPLLVQIEKVLKEHRDGLAQLKQRIEQGEKAGSVGHQRREMEAAVRRMRQDLESVRAKLASSGRAVELLDHQVSRLKQDTQDTQRLVGRNEAWRRPGGPAGSFAGLTDPLPTVPSPLLIESFDYMERLVSHLAKYAADLEGTLRPSGPDPSSSLDARGWATVPPLLARMGDLIVRTAARVESLDRAVGRAREAALARRRQVGAEGDPFEEAAQRDVAAARAARGSHISHILVMPRATPQPGAATQQGGLPGAAPAASTAPPLFGGFGGATSTSTSAPTLSLTATTTAAPATTNTTGAVFGFGAPAATASTAAAPSAAPSLFGGLTVNTNANAASTQPAAAPGGFSLSFGAAGTTGTGAGAGAAPATSAAGTDGAHGHRPAALNLNLVGGQGAASAPAAPLFGAPAPLTGNPSTPSTPTAAGLGAAPGGFGGLFASAAGNGNGSLGPDVRSRKKRSETVPSPTG